MQISIRSHQQLEDLKSHEYGYGILFSRSFHENIGRWNVGRVKDMRLMFHGASQFNQDIGEWDVSNVTNMGYVC
jgi:surface protein